MRKGKETESLRNIRTKRQKVFFFSDSLRGFFSNFPADTRASCDTKVNSSSRPAPSSVSFSWRTFSFQNASADVFQGLSNDGKKSYWRGRTGKEEKKRGEKGRRGVRKGDRESCLASATFLQYRRSSSTTRDFPIIIIIISVFLFLFSLSLKGRPPGSRKQWDGSVLRDYRRCASL